MVDFALPGSAARGATIADLARRIADRFEIPEHLLRDLDIAARLQEIGKVVSPDTQKLSRENAPASAGPDYVVSSTAVMQQVEWLRPAADIVRSISENWDGTGLPDRLHKGQVPLRSRILRILIDFLEAMLAPEHPSPQTVASELAEHIGIPSWWCTFELW
jgi:response regulator RpfG family c-di-GMP phosphodiesterase